MPDQLRGRQMKAMELDRGRNAYRSVPLNGGVETMYSAKIGALPDLSANLEQKEHPNHLYIARPRLSGLMRSWIVTTRGSCRAILLNLAAPFSVLGVSAFGIRP
jgi:hypothetical protein